MIVEAVTDAAAVFVARRMRAADAAEIAAIRGSLVPEELAAECSRRGPLAWVVGLPRHPIACLGVMPLRPGVLEAWMFATDAFPQIGLPLTRWLSRCIVPALTDAGAHRVQAHSMEGHSVAHRWLESLGAEHEHTVPCLGAGAQDFRVYAWLRRPHV